MPPPEIISLLVIDPSEVFRESLRTLLATEAPDCEVVGEVADGEEGVELAGRLDPDVILLERQLPGENGFRMLAHLRSVSPSARVLMTSVDWDPPTIEAALERGAAGVLPKNTAAERLVEAVRRIAGGKTYRPAEDDESENG